MYVEYLNSGEPVDLMLPAAVDDTPQGEEDGTPQGEEEAKTFTKKAWVAEMK